MSECPYEPCQASVTLIEQPPYPGSQGAVRLVVRSHAIVHPILIGRCPASLLGLPLSDEAKQVLGKWQERDNAVIGQAIAREHRTDERRRTEAAIRRREERKERERRAAAGASAGWSPFASPPAPAGVPANPPPSWPIPAAPQLKAGSMGIQEAKANLGAASVKLGEMIGAAAEIEERTGAMIENIAQALRHLAPEADETETIGSAHAITTSAGADLVRARAVLEEAKHAAIEAQNLIEQYIGTLGG